MINPSAAGWINKYFTEQKSVKDEQISAENFYNDIRKTGLIYGHIISFETIKSFETKLWTSEEFSKVALLNALFSIYKLVTANDNSDLFLQKAVNFYDEMNPHDANWLQKVLPGNSITENAEKIIDDRVQTNENILSKKFSPILTNALLFEDVLAFEQFLIHGSIPSNYLRKLEETIVNIVSMGLQTKTVKSQYDDLLLKLFQSSVRYTKFSNVTTKNFDALALDFLNSKLEKFYLIDLAGITLYDEGNNDEKEHQFLTELATALQISADFVNNSIAERNQFMLEHKRQIPYFNDSNPVKNFYDHATKTVTVLISRNKKRLLKELANNGELALLLTQSTLRNLDNTEKKKIKKQLLEICKTIPSLTIFMLPGGSILLPIFIKFIPKMLPSAFNENLEEKE
jgi:hypothetical protein